MSNNPKISVVMSVYNGEKYLREAIESILNQTFSDFEFIIVNDASTDSSVKIIRSYQDERIRLINNEQNIGLTKSLNKAMNQAKGKYIARQDADDISLPNRFEKQIEYLEKHPEVAVLGSSIYVIDENGEIMKKEIATPKPSQKLLKSNAIVHGSAMFRKTIVKELGGYDELFRYVQDYEFWLRIEKHHELRNMRQVLYKLRSHGMNIGLINWEESALYHLLALRIARNELDIKVRKTLGNKGIRSLRAYLSKKEEVFFRKSIASIHLQRGELRLAREEYKKVFNSAPFDIHNDINIVRSSLGQGVMRISSKCYEIIRNFFTSIQNWNT